MLVSMCVFVHIMHMYVHVCMYIFSSILQGFFPLYIYLKEDSWVCSHLSLILIPPSAPQLVYQRLWYVLSCLLTGKITYVLAAVGLLFHYLSGPLHYNIIPMYYGQREKCFI